MLMWCGLILFLTTSVFAVDTNLSCYQCTRTTNVECGQETLLPCPPVSDRCVTHLTKDATRGFTIKRECGLGPCGFDDDMVNKGLGLDDCDRSKDEFFCVFCCRGSGCNKSNAATSMKIAHRHLFSVLLVSVVIITFFFRSICPNFIPPSLQSLA